MTVKQTTFELADKASDGLMTTIHELIDKTLAENVAEFQSHLAGEEMTILHVYETANAMRLIGSTALLASTRLTAIANNLRIEEVG